MKERIGFRSPKYGHKGVYFLSTGPDPRGPRPGPRLQAVIYDAHHNVMRRFEQAEGECIDPGYVDFFLGPNCRSAKFRMPLVDIALDGTVTTLVPDFQPEHPRSVLENAFRSWVENYGEELLVAKE